MEEEDTGTVTMVIFLSFSFLCLSSGYERTEELGLMEMIFGVCM